LIPKPWSIIELSPSIPRCVAFEFTGSNAGRVQKLRTVHHINLYIFRALSYLGGDHQLAFHKRNIYRCEKDTDTSTRTHTHSKTFTHRAQLLNFVLQCP